MNYTEAAGHARQFTRFLRAAQHIEEVVTLAANAEKAEGSAREAAAEVIKDASKVRQDATRVMREATAAAEDQRRALLSEIVGLKAERDQVAKALTGDRAVAETDLTTLRARHAEVIAGYEVKRANFTVELAALQEKISAAEDRLAELRKMIGN